MQSVTNLILRHIEDSDILHDGGDVEVLEVISYDEINKLKSCIGECDLTSFIVNLSIMYVNQGLLYAKSKLAFTEFCNYIMWFEIYKFEEDFIEDHYYDCRVNFSLDAKSVFHDYLVNPFNVDEDKKLSVEIKDVNGLCDFCCYAIPCYNENFVYAFVPKRIVDRYKDNRLYV